MPIELFFLDDIHSPKIIRAFLLVKKASLICSGGPTKDSMAKNLTFEVKMRAILVNMLLCFILTFTEIGFVNIKIKLTNRSNL